MSAIFLALARRIGGLEIYNKAGADADALARRIGGLEMADMYKEAIALLARRIGGLEIRRNSHLLGDVPCPPHRRLRNLQ